MAEALQPDQAIACADDDPPEQVAFFGVDPATGGLLRPPKSWQEIRDCVISTFRLHELLPQIAKERRLAEAHEPAAHRGRPPQGVDPKDLGSAGWGVIYAEGVDEAVKTALEPLVEHRSAQAGPLFKRFEGHNGLRAELRAADWLQQLRVGVGVGDVRTIPYYLMIVGDPQVLPFGVEFDLSGSSYAVGRLAFDTPEEYGRYAANVIAAETRPPRPRRITFVGMKHPDDITRSSYTHLVQPLVKEFRDSEGWEVRAVVGDEAIKSRLAEVLGGSGTPSILFTAGHGLGPGPRGDISRLGALLCAPYPGPKNWAGRGPLPQDYVFAARDVPPNADLRGLVAVLFGCYTAGMPSHDSFCFEPPRPLGAARLASLAARLLSHERGALAVLGHVDRAWSYSYLWRKVTQPHAFRSVLGALLAGEPIGAAASYLGDRYNALMRELLFQKEQLLRRREIDMDCFVRDWMTERDARAYMVYGDPAVRPTVSPP